MLVSGEPPAAETTIRLEIRRRGEVVVADETTLAQMKRSPLDLAGYLFRENKFPNGCFLLTGTGIVPPDDFTLRVGDEIRIKIDAIGTLRNLVD